MSILRKKVRQPRLGWLIVFLALSVSVNIAFAATTNAATSSLIAYLSDGNLWAINSDGTNQRLIALAPKDSVIQDFVWSADGQRIYFAVGSRIYDASVYNGNLASAGTLTLPAQVTLDKLELGRDKRTLIVHALDQEGLTRSFGLILGTNTTNELSVDEYNTLANLPAPIIRNIGETSIAPDAQFVLFKEAIGTSEELFVAEVETGRRWQISTLTGMAGFEPSAETLGSRFIIEATWSPDGRYVIYNPAQACSETGLCYGNLFLVEMWGGVSKQLSLDMMISVPTEWNPQQSLLAYDDKNEIVLSDKQGQTNPLASGSRPKWQPVAAAE